MKRKRLKVQTLEERAQERGMDPRQLAAQCRKERMEAELAGHKPGAAGLTARSRRPKC
jgi:hypothetical protein